MFYFYLLLCFICYKRQIKLKKAYAEEVLVAPAGDAEFFEEKTLPVWEKVIFFPATITVAVIIKIINEINRG